MKIYFAKKEIGFSYSKMKKIMNCKKGFTYMELMVATVIIGLVAAFFCTSISSALLATNDVQDISRGTDLAQRYMETVKSDLSFQSSYDLTVAGTTPPVTVTSDYTDSGYFAVITNVTNLQTDTIDGVVTPVLKQVDVEYQRASDSLSVINLSTIVARPE